MKKILFVISLIPLLFILACAQNNQTACTAEAKICPDGTAVGRTGPNCEFSPCPTANASKCDYNNPDRTYLKKEANCVINFMCMREREAFRDECGCGCALKETNNTQTMCEPSDCGPQLGMPNYICPDGKTIAGPTGICLRNSDGGCGWEVARCPTANQNQSLNQNSCTADSRNGDMCMELYKPVCGWFDPAKIQCIKYPCAQTFSNSCFACHDSKVLYWTEGECPK